MDVALRLAAAAAVLLTTLAAAVPARAELICDPQGTIVDCWERYMPATPALTDPSFKAALASDKAEAASAAEEKLKNFETGLDGGSAALATTTRNFLPLLSLAGLVTDSDGNSTDNLLTLDLNFLIPTLGPDKNAQLKAVLNTEPELFTPLREAVEAVPGGSDLATSLESQLDAADDYTVAFTYSHINRKFGRSFKQYQDRFSKVFEAAITRATDEVSTRSALALQDFLVERVGNADLGKPLKDTPGLQEKVEQAAGDEAALERRLKQIATENHLPQFAELVNSQPQLTVSAQFRERDDLVGAREQSLKVAYEFGFASVGGFEEAAGRSCDTPTNVADAATCLKSYKAYVDGHEQHLRNADRIVAELSYVDIGDYSFEQDGISVARKGSTRLDVSLGGGRTLRALGEDRETRLDLVAKYEDYSDDPDRRDRLVATLTLTTKANGFSIPISLVYANHGEFLPQVDEELTAHIGVKFSLDPKKEE